MKKTLLIFSLFLSIFGVLTYGETRRFIFPVENRKYYIETIDSNSVGTYYLSDLNDILLTSAATDDLLVYSGSTWANTPRANHALLKNLAYADANHTGFEPTIAPAEGASGAFNLEVPLEMIDYGIANASGSPPNKSTFLRTYITLDSDDYDGALYYFEIVALNSYTGTYNVYLYDVTNAAVKATIVVAANTTLSTRFRSAAWTPASSANITYAVQIDMIAAGAEYLTVYAGRIIVVQSGATKTRIQIPLIQEFHNTHSYINTNAIRVDWTVSTSYTQNDAEQYSRYNKNSSAYSTIAGWQFEGVLAVSSPQTVSATLWNVTDNTQVSSSEITLSSATPTLVTSLEFADSAANFHEGDNFEVYIKTSINTSTASIGRAALYVRLTSLTKAEVIWRVCAYDYVGSDAHVVDQRVLFNSTLYTNPTTYFEVTGSSVNSAAIVYLRDHSTNDSNTDGTNITGSAITLASATKTRWRSSSFSLTDSDRYYIYEDWIGGNLHVNSAWLVIKNNNASTMFWNGQKTWAVVQKSDVSGLGIYDTPTFTGITLSGLTASRLVSTDSAKAFVSSDLTAWVTGTANEITVVDDADGTITLDIPNPLIAGKGGTGAATLTDHSILLGSGTDAITALGSATNGQLAIGSTGADPILAALTGTANQITVTNAAGGITLSCPQDIHTGATPSFTGLTLIGDPSIISSANEIEIKPSGDTDDYLQFLTSGNFPIIKIIGGPSCLVQSDTTNSPFFTFYEDDSHYVEWGWNGIGNYGSLQCEGGDLYYAASGSIHLQSSGDMDDYITLTTVANVPTIGTVGSCNLKITASSGLIDFDNENLITTGALTVDSPTLCVNLPSYTDKVGIGTATPSQSLDLIGSLELEDTTTSTTGVIYKGANRFIHNYYDPDGNGVGGPIPDGKNTFVGVDAGNFTMGSTATQTYHSSYNTAVGYQALYSNTTGYYNSAIGAISLRTNTTGVSNTGIGWGTLFSNLNGSSNVGLGMAALFANTSGTGNFGLGATSLRYNTIGSYNIGIGTNALFRTVTGSANVGIGSFAGQGASGNSYNNNTLIGYGSGYSLTTGSSDVFLGYKSGYNQTTNSNLLIIDNQNRTSVALEITNSLIYGVFNATPASQTIRFNAGTTTLLGNLVIGDAGYIGSASDTDAIQIEADGDVVLSQDLAVIGTVTGNSFTVGSNVLTALIDRGDPATVDYAVASFTFDATWRDLDLSAIVPANAKFVNLRVQIQDGAAGSYFQLRKNGNVNSANIFTLRTQVATIYNDAGTFIACDANRVIEYRGGAGIDVLNLTVAGWVM